MKLQAWAIAIFLLGAAWFAAVQFLQADAPTPPVPPARHARVNV